MKTPLISKSKYMNGLQCPKLLWTCYNAKELIPETDAATQAVFDQGHKVGLLAQSLFPGGVEVEWSDDFDSAIRDTQKLLPARQPIYEATFAAAGVFARADIMNPTDDGRWDIIEVKSSTGVKKIYLEDMALQRHCIESANIPIRRCFVMHIANQYVRHGPVDARLLFKAEDVTDAVTSNILPVVGKRVAEMQRIIAQEICPVINVGPHCDYPRPCPLKTICRGEPHKAEALVKPVGRMEYGPHVMQELKKTCWLDWWKTELVNRQMSCPEFHKEEIAAFLFFLDGPLYLLDFETFMAAIPMFDESRPYQQIPFQFSLHIIEPQGDELVCHKLMSEPRHVSWLWDGTGDPRQAMLAKLRESIGDQGTIMAYNKSFEERILRESAADVPEHADWIASLMPRMKDLAVPFRSGAVRFSELGCRWSLKAILPAMTGMDYDDLAIGDGMTASVEFMRVMFTEVDPADRAEIRKNLEEYCGQDTYGMLELLRCLHEMARTTGEEK